MLTKTSEIKTLLTKLGSNAPIQEPPRKFIATLATKNSQRASSIIFHIPTKHGDEIGHPLVMLKLLEGQVPAPLLHAEPNDSTLEYLLEQELPNGRGKNGETSLTIPGSKIRYLEKNNPETKVRSRSKADWNNPTPWKYFTDDICVTISTDAQHVVDDDPATLETNKKSALSALQKLRNEKVEQLQTLKKEILELDGGINTLKGTETPAENQENQPQVDDHPTTEQTLNNLSGTLANALDAWHPHDQYEINLKKTLTDAHIRVVSWRLDRIQRMEIQIDPCFNFGTWIGVYARCQNPQAGGGGGTLETALIDLAKSIKD